MFSGFLCEIKGLVWLLDYKLRSPQAICVDTVGQGKGLVQGSVSGGVCEELGAASAY